MNYCCSLDSSYRHLWNTGKEVRIGNFRVDAYSASKNEIIEVSGCYWHSHECFPGLVRSPEQVARYERTVARAQFIEEVTGIKVKLVWECQIPRHIKDGRPPVYLDLKKKVGKQIMSQGELLALVKTGKFFGAVEVDIEVPDSLKEKFSEFAPLFVTCETHDKRSDWRTHVQICGRATFIPETSKTVSGRSESTPNFISYSFAAVVFIERSESYASVPSHRMEQPALLTKVFRERGPRQETSVWRSYQRSPCCQTETDCQFSLWSHLAEQTELHSYSLHGRK